MGLDAAKQPGPSKPNKPARVPSVPAFPLVSRRQSLQAASRTLRRRSTPSPRTPTPPCPSSSSPAARPSDSARHNSQQQLPQPEKDRGRERSAPLLFGSSSLCQSTALAHEVQGVSFPTSALTPSSRTSKSTDRLVLIQSLLLFFLASLPETWFDSRFVGLIMVLPLADGA